MDIEIKNIDEVINTCNQILTKDQKMLENIESLENLLTKIKSSWDSTGQDKQSYEEELNKQIKNLKIIEDSVKKFANNILSYAENIKTASSKTVS